MQNRSGIPIVLLVLAILAGLLVGSYSHLVSFFTSSDEPIAQDGVEGTPVLEPSSPVQQLDKDNVPVVNVPAVPEATTVEHEEDYIRSGNGVVLQAARQNGQFLGYKVVEGGDDARLTTGSIIVAVDGVDVEDSAAGSELLIAALSNPSAPVSQIPGTE